MVNRIRLHWMTVAAIGALGLAGLTAAPGDPVRPTPAIGATTAAPADTAAERFAVRYRIPRALAILIHDQAVAMGVEPGLVFGLIATESGFDPRAVGSHGAVGLMQIKPSTARAYDRRVTREQLLRPDVNVRLGLRHLVREVEYFGHDWTLGLLAYNMGRTRLSNVLERGWLPRNRYAAKVLAHCAEHCT